MTQLTIFDRPIDPSGIPLSDVMQTLGWRHEAIEGSNNGKRRIYDDTGACVGDYNTTGVWEMLHERGLILPIPPEFLYSANALAQRKARESKGVT